MKQEVTTTAAPAETFALPLAIESSGGASITHIRLQDANGANIATIWNPGNRRRAETILRAVNTHDALVAALQRTVLELGRINLRGFEEPDLGSPEHQCLKAIPVVLDRVRAVLAKVGA